MSLTTTSIPPLHCICRGSTGPLLLLVHGFPLHHQQWIHQLNYLAANHRVLVPDLRGLGQSPLFPGQTQVTMEDHADDLNALLDALGIDEPVHYMGLSMGGYVAWQMLRKYPARVRSLVLCHTRVIADTPEQAAGRFQVAERTLEQQSAEPVLEAMLPRLLHAGVSPTIGEEVRQMAYDSPINGLAANARGLALRVDATAWLSAIQIPALAISGEYDGISSPSEMQAWSAKIPGCRFISLPGVGHLSPMEAPGLFNQTLTELASW